MSSLATRRILKDIKIIEEEKSDLFSIKPDENNIYKWKGYILPPDDSLYFGLILPFEIEFTKNYPNQAPKFKFKNNCLYHPNIFLDGNICLDILQDKWTKLHNIKSIILTIILLLKEPNPDSPANSEAANLFVNDFIAFKSKVREFTKKSWISDF